MVDTARTRTSEASRKVGARPPAGGRANLCLPKNQSEDEDEDEKEKEKEKKRGTFLATIGYPRQLRQRQ
jgi:hypothetical protein